MKLNWHYIGKIALKTLLWLGIGTYLFSALSFSMHKSDSTTCAKYSIRILGEYESAFITAKDVEQLIARSSMDIKHVPFSDINTDALEKLLYTHPAIRKAEVFKTIDSTIHFEIHQRIPVIRIIESSGKSYYIDEEGYILPASQMYSSYVLIMNGNIKTSINPQKQVCIFNTDSTIISSHDLTEIKNIFSLAEHIYKDELLKAQIVQIYANNENDFELIPRVGDNLIIFGSTDDMVQKFDNLKAMYSDAFKYTGWNTYDTINIQFSNQVICSKR